MIEVICKVCGKSFFARESQIKIGTGKCCSPKCRGAYVNKPTPVEDRIMKFISVKEIDECWEFNGFRNSDGYGRIGIRGSKTDSAHRVMYKLHKGEIPEGMVVMHACDNPPCCNPSHLKLGSQQENIEDMVAKKRLVNKFGEDSHLSKLTKEQVKEIISKYTGAKGEKAKLAREYNVCQTTINNILTGKSWNRGLHISIQSL